MEKKYKLTDVFIEHHGHRLYQIQALRDFGNVKAGDLGGYIESESSLSHEGNAWVCGSAKVFGKAMVFGNAKIFGKAKVFGNAKVFGKAMVYGVAEVYDHAKVYDHALVYGVAKVYDHAKVFGNALVFDYSIICGTASVCGEAVIQGSAVLRCKADYILFKNWWSSGRFFTWTRSNDMWRVGCFYGTGEELVKKAFQDSEESGREYKRIVDYVESIKGVTNK